VARRRACAPPRAPRRARGFRSPLPRGCRWPLLVSSLMESGSGRRIGERLGRGRLLVDVGVRVVVLLPTSAELWGPPKRVLPVEKWGRRPPT
jgi:hypothetical protein